VDVLQRYSDEGHHLRSGGVRVHCGQGLPVELYSSFAITSECLLGLLTWERGLVATGLVNAGFLVHRMALSISNSAQGLALQRRAVMDTIQYTCGLGAMLWTLASILSIGLLLWFLPASTGLDLFPALIN
jgi:hypothetical protein